MKTYRIIFHIDMNCFFAACEIAANPELSGKAIVVAHDDQLGRGLILSPSYEARRFGIYTTMKVKEAYKLCPNLIVVAPNYHLYQQYSNKFRQYLTTFTNKVEMFSIDEAYVDLTDLDIEKDILGFAKKVQDYILHQIGVPCSIGIAPNKYLAKMASDMQKPLGITILRKRDVPSKLWNLPIQDMWGVGKKTAVSLKEIDILTIGDLANYKDIERLENKVGKLTAATLLYWAAGNDNSPVESEQSLSTSVSASHTFDADIYDLNIIFQTFKNLINSVCYKMQSNHQAAQTFGIQVKYGNFNHFSHSLSVRKPSNNEKEFERIVKELMDEYYDSEIGARLIGVYANRLVEATVEPTQISIFDDLDELTKKEHLNKLLSDMKNIYGSEAIKKGYYDYKK